MKKCVEDCVKQLGPQYLGLCALLCAAENIGNGGFPKVEVLPKCRSEKCEITIYKFAWKDVTITGATGSFVDRSRPPNTTTRDISGDPTVKDSDFTKRAVDRKAEDQKGKSLPKKIEVNAGTYSLIDAACGSGGECYCDKIAGAQGTPLTPIAKTFRIKGLTEGARSFDQPRDKCMSFDITITVTVTPEVFEGKCLSLDEGVF